MVFEGSEGNIFMDQEISPPAELRGDKYIRILASIATMLGNTSIITGATRFVSGKNSHIISCPKAGLSSNILFIY